MKECCDLKKHEEKISAHCGEPAPVCYCFGYTRKVILDDIAISGYSTIESRIKEAIKKGACRCEVANPEGICCLGNVFRITKEARIDK